MEKILFFAKKIPDRLIFPAKSPKILHIKTAKRFDIPDLKTFRLSDNLMVIHRSVDEGANAKKTVGVMLV